MLPFFNIGPFAIPAKPFVIILGIYATLWLVENTIDELNLEAEWLRSTAFNGIVAGLIGSRFVFALIHWEATLANPVSVVWPITIGYSLWGAILCGLLFLLYSTIQKQVNVLQLLDSIAPSLLILIGAWVIGDFLGGPGFGTTADLPLFNRHPVQLYEFLVALIAMAAWRYARPQKSFDGWLFLVTAVIFLIGILITLNFRGGSLTVLGGWQLNQIITFLAILLTIGTLAFWSPDSSQGSLTSN